METRLFGTSWTLSLYQVTLGDGWPMGLQSRERGFPWVAVVAADKDTLGATIKKSKSEYNTCTREGKLQKMMMIWNAHACYQMKLKLNLCKPITTAQVYALPVTRRDTVDVLLPIELLASHMYCCWSLARRSEMTSVPLVRTLKKKGGREGRGKRERRSIN